MRYELKHDKLALQIYELVSVEAKARRKAENIYHLYDEISTARLFTEEELEYLAQFQPVLRPNERLLTAIGESKKELNRTRQEEAEREMARLEREKELLKRVKVRQKRISLVIGIAGVVAGALLIFALKQSRRAAINQQRTEEIKQNLERKNMLSDGLKKELSVIIHEKGENNVSDATAYAAELNEKFPSVFVDVRDWTLYETVELNKQTWMAENLKYDAGKESSWVYENNPENVERYGRLYTWEAAQKACPTGWRVPTDEEWRKMTAQFGATDFYQPDENAPASAFEALIAGGNSNFGALLSGKRYPGGNFDDLGLYGDYWTNSTIDTLISDAWIFSFNGETRKLERYHYSKSLGVSCRCVKE